MSTKRNLLLYLGLALLGAVIVSNAIQSFERKEAELTKIRTEYQQLQEEKNLLEKQKVELEETKKQLEKKLEAKAQVRVASARYVPNGDCLKWMSEAGITDTANAYKLIGRESGCRWNATNKSSGAYGIPQALPGYKMQSAGADWKTNPVTQLRWMQNYCFARYGSWANALAHSYAKGWY